MILRLTTDTPSLPYSTGRLQVGPYLPMPTFNTIQQGRYFEMKTKGRTELPTSCCTAIVQSTARQPSHQCADALYPTLHMHFRLNIPISLLCDGAGNVAKLTLKESVEAIN